MSKQEEVFFSLVHLLFIFYATPVHRPLRAIETAHVYFHQFYFTHSFTIHDRLVVAITALLLASKTEECAQRIENVSGSAGGGHDALVKPCLCCSHNIYIYIYIYNPFLLLPFL